MNKYSVIATAIIRTFLLVTMLAACTDSVMTERRLEEIKEEGDTCPAAALASYDSLRGEVATSTRRIRYKYALLGVRLRDKAYMKPESDSCIMRLVTYFERRGTNREKQEVYYYAGSVYRDLQDAPRSLEYFRKSADCAGNGEVDSVVLRNCHSQLYSCYTRVQDYANALKEAKEEYMMCKKMGIYDVVSQVHVANAYMRTDSMSKASQYMREALQETIQNHAGSNARAALYDILYYLAVDGDVTHTEQCYEKLKSIGGCRPCTAREHIALGRCFELMGATDSCTHHYQQAFEMDDMFCRYDAAKILFYLYDSIGNREKAYKYAGEYLRVSEELDLGARQEQAASVNNQYQYYKDKEQEERDKAERARLRMAVCTISIGFLAFLCLAYALHIHRKCQRMNALRKIDRDNKKMMDADTEMGMLAAIRDSVEESRCRLQCMKDQMAQMKRENEENSREACRQMEMGRHALMMAYATGKVGAQEETIARLKDAAERKRTLSQEEWGRLCALVESQRPGFLHSIAGGAAKHKEEWLHTCCLLALGLSSTEILALVSNVSRATVFRWCGRYKELLDYAGTPGAANPSSQT